MWSPLWPYLFLGLLTVIFFHDMIFQSRVFFWRDNYQMHVWPPFSGMAMTGEWYPLWNPFLGGGKPYFAEPVSAMAYPLNWLYIILPPIRALMAMTALQLWIFGISLYALCRHWSFRKAPALLAAVSTMFGTLIVTSMDSQEPFAALTWGPLVLLLASICLERLRAGMLEFSWIGGLWKNIQYPLLLGCVIAVQFLAGFPQAMLNILLLTGLYLVARCLFLRDWRLLILVSIAFGFAGALALGLSMAQLLPTMELIGFTERGQAIDPRQDMASFHPWRLLNMLLPFLFGRAGYPQEFWPGTIFEFWAGTSYIGILSVIMLCLAPLALLNRAEKNFSLHRFLFWFFLSVAIISLMLAAGLYTPFYMVCYHLVPGFGHFRWPSKFLQVFLYSTAIFSALGFNALLGLFEERPALARRITIGVLVACVALLIAAVAGYFSLASGPGLLEYLTKSAFIDTPAHLAFCRADFWNLALLLGISIVLLGLLLMGKVPRSWIAIGCIVLVFGDLMAVSRKIYQVTTDAVYESGTDLEFYAAPKKDQLLVLSQYNSIAQFLYGSGNEEAMRWVRKAGGGNMLQPQGIHECYQQGMSLLKWQRLMALTQQLPPAQAEHIADLMSVGYIVRGNDFPQVLWGGAPKDIAIGKRPNAMPRAFLVSQWSFTPTSDMALQQIASEGFDPHIEAVVEPLADEPNTAIEAKVDYDWLKPAGTVSGGVSHTWSTAEVDVEVTRDALLVTTETWYPGWKAFVDGKPVPIYRVNYNYRGVFLKPGKHHVLYKYEPRPLKIGAGISLASVALVLCLGTIRLRTRPAASALRISSR